MPVQFTLPPDTRAVGTGNPPADMNGVVDTLIAAGLPNSVLNAAFAGGADPTGVADSGAAFAACKTAALAAGQPMLIPPGTYRITAALNWKNTNLVVNGAGQGTTIISQATANIPVAQVAGNYQDISGITLTYATPQTSGQTGAINLTFGDDSAGSCFEGNYHELNLVNGNTGMAIDPTIVTVAGMFSCRIANVNISASTLSFISLDGNNSHGVANCTGCVFENIYCAANSGTVAGFPVVLKNWDEFVFTELNVEHCTISAQDVLSLSSVGNAVFNGLHFEALTTSLNGSSLLHLTNAGTTVINGMSARFNVYSGSGSNPVVKFFGTGVTTLEIHGSNETSNTVTTPSHPWADFGSATNCLLQVTGQAATQTNANAVNTGAGDVVQFGNPAVTGMQALTSGFTSFATGGAANLLNSTSGSNTSMVAGTTYYAALWIPYNCTLTGIVVLTGTVGLTDNWIVALWNAVGGANLAHSALAGTAAPAAATKIRIPFTTPIAVTGPAVYYIGLQSNGTTARFQGFGNATEGFVAGSVSGSFGTLPSLSPGTTYNQNVGPAATTY